MKKLYDKKDLAPRRTMTEKAFRKMEGWIGRACTSGSYVVDPRTEMPWPMNQNTFQIRFTEARRGFELYGYKSDHIPPGYPVRAIKVKMLNDGRVVVENQFQDAALAKLRGEVVDAPVMNQFADAAMRHEFMRMEAQQEQEIGKKVIVPGDSFVEKSKMVEAMMKDPKVVEKVNYIVKNRDKNEKEVNVEWLTKTLEGLPIEVMGQAGDGLNIVFYPKSLPLQGEETSE